MRPQPLEFAFVSRGVRAMLRDEPRVPGGQRDPFEGMEAWWPRAWPPVHSQVQMLGHRLVVRRLPITVDFGVRVTATGDLAAHGSSPFDGLHLAWSLVGPDPSTAVLFESNPVRLTLGPADFPMPPPAVSKYDTGLATHTDRQRVTFAKPGLYFALPTLDYEETVRVPLYVQLVETATS
jgi:hypothetical protein